MTPEAGLGAELRLVGFDQIANALRIALAVTVTADGIGAAGRFNYDLGPEDAGGDVYRRDLGNRDALFVAAEEATLDAGNSLRADHELCREKEVSLRPPGSGESSGPSKVSSSRSRRSERDLWEEWNARAYR